MPLVVEKDLPRHAEEGDFEGERPEYHAQTEKPSILMAKINETQGTKSRGRPQSIDPSKLAQKVSRVRNGTVLRVRR